VPAPMWLAGCRRCCVDANSETMVPPDRTAPEGAAGGDSRNDCRQLARRTIGQRTRPADGLIEDAPVLGSDFPPHHATAVLVGPPPHGGPELRIVQQFHDHIGERFRRDVCHESAAVRREHFEGVSVRGGDDGLARRHRV